MSRTFPRACSCWPCHRIIVSPLHPTYALQSCFSCTPHSVHLPPPHTSYVQTLNIAKCTFDNLSCKFVKLNEFLQHLTRRHWSKPGCIGDQVAGSCFPTILLCSLQASMRPAPTEGSSWLPGGCAPCCTQSSIGQSLQVCGPRVHAYVCRVTVFLYT